MIFTIGFAIIVITGIIGVINDRNWFNDKLDYYLGIVCNIGILLAVYSFLTWAWKNLP